MGGVWRETLNVLHDIQLTIVKEMPDEGSPLEDALNKLDALIDHLEGYEQEVCEPGGMPDNEMGGGMFG